MAKLQMHCPNCKELTETEYNGLQHGLPVRDSGGNLVKLSNGKYLLKSIELYTCNKCGSTYGKETD